METRLEPITIRPIHPHHPEDMIRSRWSRSEGRTVRYLLAIDGRDEVVTTTPVVAVLSRDGLTVRTRSGSVYRLEAPGTIDWPGLPVEAP